MTARNNTNGTPAIVVEDLRKEFFRNDGRHGLRRRRKRVAALDGVTFEVGAARPWRSSARTGRASRR